jgi:hypothetical protein
VVGHLSAKDSMKGTLGGGPLLGNPKDEVFERHTKLPVDAPPPLSLSVQYKTFHYCTKFRLTNTVYRIISLTNFNAQFFVQ